MSTSMFSAEK